MNKRMRYSIMIGEHIQCPHCAGSGRAERETEWCQVETTPENMAQAARNKYPGHTVRIQDNGAETITATEVA